MILHLQRLRFREVQLNGSLLVLCVPKIRFCNIDGEGRQGQVVRRRRRGAQSRDGEGRPCSEIDGSSTHYSRRHIRVGSGAGALRQTRSCGRDIRGGSSGIQMPTRSICAPPVAGTLGDGVILVSANPLRTVTAMAANAIKPVRCAIYTRKSTEHGLEQEFNSLDAQRDACEAYIRSKRHVGGEAAPPPSGSPRCC